MPRDLQFGYRIPSDGDKGATVFQVLTTFLERLVSHSHDGSNSASITGLDHNAFAHTTVNLPAASWVSFGSLGEYYQDVDVPMGVTKGRVSPILIDSGNNFIVAEIGVSPLDANKFRVVVNDNSLALKLLLI